MSCARNALSCLMEVPERVIKLPILDTARTVVGKIQTANIVAVGCINGLLGLTDVENLRQAVMIVRWL